MVRLPPLVVVISALAMAACGGGSPAATLLTGTWGGTNVSLQATSTGATLQFKCGATGVIAQPVRLDDQGRFDAPGTYDPVLLAGGPRPADFHGQVVGSQMTLSFTVQGSTTSLGPYELTKDTPARFDVCNF